MALVMSGFFLGISLIVAVGPQNILMIKQGIRREYITLVIAICFCSDMALYAIGVLSVGHISQLSPHILLVLRWLGALYLLWFAAMSIRDALHPKRVSVIDSQEPQRVIDPDYPGGGTALKTRQQTQTHTTQRTWVQPALAALTLTWLNPGAYVDTIVMVSGIANQYGNPGRWLFTLGALLASAVWFPMIGYGARALSRPLSSPQVWRVLNWVIAGILCLIAMKLITAS
ncbi:LysE family transporter [Corynebacterium sp. 3HC-13]|uniref:LysE/ArgO family amino acid transporter n=1 Tax=Corynebacterium poyangense TaxID=2684405 RepID=UPI001CCFE040|nr:LysE family transporter [Corynebacterium poyangense]MBZ8177122.1 LysE family transporter [Corynebacterium poyangense]